MLAGFSVIAVLSALDREKRGVLEKWEEVTGVEDKAYFSMPAKLDPAPSPAAKLAGKPLYLESMETIGIHDSDVCRVAKDSETGLTIYRALDPKAAQISGKGEAYLLKTETGRYAKLKFLDR